MYSNLLIIIQTLFQIIWLMAGTLLRRKLLPAYPEMDLMNANLCWLLRSNRYHKQSGMWAILDVIFFICQRFWTDHYYQETLFFCPQAQWSMQKVYFSKIHITVQYCSTYFSRQYQRFGISCVRHCPLYTIHKLTISR